MGITLWQYYSDRAAEAACGALSEIHTAADWEQRRRGLHRQFMDSLGLDPLPERCPLNLTERGCLAGQDYVARKVAFQILPDCWSSAVIYVPDPLPSGRCPGVLYLCGHGPLGATDYQAHAVRWAQRGYVCLLLDTIEQNDNPGEHHGLYAEVRTDWVSLGYTAAGGELWNTLRALDVLAGLPEVDPARLGATGVSGGGTLSFFAAMADSRLRAIASSCGVSIPRDALHRRHLLNHCDCIFYHNRYGRDPSEYAALLAPRAALFYFSASDFLFSPQESRDFVERVQRVYTLLGAGDRCSFLLRPGPHGEPPEALRAIDLWFDRHVAGAPHKPVAQPVPDQTETALTVFNGAPPEPNRLDLLPELFSRRGTPELPLTAAAWSALQARVLNTLRTNVFGRLDALHETLTLERQNDAVSVFQMTTCRAYGGQIGGVDVWLETVRPQGAKPIIFLGVAGQDEVTGDLIARLRQQAHGDTAKAAFEPRGTGFSAASEARSGALLRAALLDGLTPVMLMVQDLRLLMGRFVELEEVKGSSIFLYGRGDAAVACLYHALMDERVAGVVMDNPPVSHRQGAPVLGILRHLDLDQAIGLMAPRPVALVSGEHGWRSWAMRVYARLGLADRLVVEPLLCKAFERVVAAQTPSR
jgi:dienelactone hydrolase